MNYFEQYDKNFSSYYIEAENMILFLLGEHYDCKKRYVNQRFEAE